MHLGERPGTTSSRSGSVASRMGPQPCRPHSAWGAVRGVEPRSDSQDMRRREWERRAAIWTVAPRGAPCPLPARRTYDDQSTVICTFQSTLVNAERAVDLQVQSRTKAVRCPWRVLAGLLVRVQSGEHDCRSAPHMGGAWVAATWQEPRERGGQHPRWTAINGLWTAV